MTHIAKIAVVDKVANINEELMPFVEFRAEKDKRKLSGDESVIILQIEGTQSYHPIFLPANLEDIEKELKELNVELGSDAKKTVKSILSN